MCCIVNADRLLHLTVVDPSLFGWHIFAEIIVVVSVFEVGLVERVGCIIL